MRTIVSGVAQNARRYLGDQRLRAWVEETLHEFGPHGALQGLLSRWSEKNDRPLVLVIFDRTPDTPWEKKRFVREEQYEKHRIGIWGM